MALRVLKQKPSKKGSKRVPKKHRTNGSKLGKAHSFRTPKREINPVIALTSLEENYNYPIVCSNLGGKFLHAGAFKIPSELRGAMFSIRGCNSYIWLVCPLRWRAFVNWWPKT